MARKPFIVVHQEDVEEFDNHADALKGLEETEQVYHEGQVSAYSMYDFEAGIYQIVEEGTVPQIELPNRREFTHRNDWDLNKFAVVDKADNSDLIGGVINVDGANIELTEDNLPELTYHGFETFDEAREEFERRRNNDAGLYSLVTFKRIPGRKPFKQKRQF